MEAISTILSRLYQRLGLSGEIEGWRAVDEWPRLVGPRIAQHARAVGFRGGTLRVEVDGSAWMHELSFLQHELLRKIHREPGGARVREIRFVVPRQGGQR